MRVPDKKPVNQWLTGYFACFTILRKSGGPSGKETALPFSERQADRDQKHGIVVGQKIGHVHGRVPRRVKIQKQDQQI